MKRIFVSQRVDVVTGYDERRDALDQRWTVFLRETGGTAFPLPNHRESIMDMLEALTPDGILLTGGNSPAEYGGDAPERDAADAMLIGCAVRREIPLIGVCRGMQSVLLHFGGSLREISGHVAVRHEVSLKERRAIRFVNSYHSLAADHIPPCLEPLAHSLDGAAEAVAHVSLPIAAMMWHPERERTFGGEDIELFRQIWEGRNPL